MSALQTIDDGTLQAIQVLAAAVERERIPGIVEFHQTADALSRVYATRALEDLEDAVTAFDSLDQELRARIKARAHSIARTERDRLPVPRPPRASQPAGSRVAPARRAGRSGFLDALNGGTSRSAGRERLLADLGRRAVDESIPIAEIVPPPLNGPAPNGPASNGPTLDGPPPKWW